MAQTPDSRGFVQSLSRSLKATRLERLRRPVSIGINGSVLLIVGLLLYRNRDMLPQLARLLSPKIIGNCFVLYFSSMVVQFLIWKDLMGYQHTETSRAIEEYINTNFMALLPGGLWKIFGRMTIYRAPHMSSNTILLINLLENLLLLIAGAVVLLGMTPFLWYVQGSIVLFLLLMIVLMHIRLAPFLPILQDASPLTQYAHWLLWITGYVLAWACGGIITFLVLTTFGFPLPVTEALRYWCIAVTAGLVLQALPINALARDATIVALLVKMATLAKAIIAAFALRLVMLLCEIAIGWSLLAIIWLIKRYVPNVSKQGKPQMSADTHR